MKTKRESTNVRYAPTNQYLLHPDIWPEKLAKGMTNGLVDDYPTREEALKRELKDVAYIRDWYETFGFPKGSEMPLKKKNGQIQTPYRNSPIEGLFGPIREALRDMLYTED